MITNTITIDAKKANVSIKRKYIFFSMNSIGLIHQFHNMTFVSCSEWRQKLTFFSPILISKDRFLDKSKSSHFTRNKIVYTHIKLTLY